MASISIVNTTDRTLTLIGLAQEIEMILLFLILVNAIRDKEHFVIFLRGLYLGFAAEAVIYVIQNILGFSFDIVGNTKVVGGTSLKHNYIGSQRGTFGTAPATAALYFVVLTMGLLGNYLSGKRLPIRLNAVLGGAMGVGCLILSAKRAPMLGFALALVCFSILMAYYAPRGLNRLAPIVLALTIPAVALLPILLIRAQHNYSDAFDERVNLMKVARNMYDDHPVAGVGFGTYAHVKSRYLPGDWQGWLSMVHNRYLLIRAETGTLGFLALLFLYAMILRAAWKGILRIGKPYRPFQIALTVALIAIFWEMAWDIFHSRQQSYILWYTTALAVMAPRILSENQRECPT